VGRKIAKTEQKSLWSSEKLLELGREIGSDSEKMIAAIESFLKVRDRNGVIGPLIANVAQREFEQNRGQHNIVLKARQMGMTTWVAARLFIKTITARGVLTVQVAQTREAAEGIFRMVQRFWECLPDDLRNGPLKRKRANVGHMSFPELDSEFRILSAADPGAGRGLSIQNLHLSELSRWPGNAQETLAGLRAALAPTGELVMESTPNGAYGCFYSEWQQAEQGATVRHFLPWWKENAYVATAVTDFTEEERALVERVGLTAEQVGFRRGLESLYRKLRSQEFAEDPESCFRATGDCCFELDAIEARLKDAPEPFAKRRNAKLHVWLPPVAGREYILAVDTAGGGQDGDFCAMQVIDRVTGAQCAELQQKLGLREQATVAAELARQYNGALLVVERNNHGAGVIAHLSNMQRKPRVFESGEVPGWLTTALNKPEVIARLGALLVESPQIFMSRRLLAECRTFVNLQGGRTGAANGSHDDLVMAMAIAQAARRSSC
jgi:hypothetical protein